MSTEASYVIPPPPRPTLAVVGSSRLFPVRRVWCVGRNYVEHIREMGQDERAPPFFFAKPADALVPDGSTIPSPPLTQDLHFEVELVVALKGGGRAIEPGKSYKVAGWASVNEQKGAPVWDVFAKYLRSGMALPLVLMAADQPLNG